MTVTGPRPHLVTHLESVDAPPSDSRDVLLYLDGFSRPGVGHYDHSEGRWKVATSPMGDYPRKVDAWAELPARWDVLP